MPIEEFSELFLFLLLLLVYIIYFNSLFLEEKNSSVPTSIENIKSEENKKKIRIRQFKNVNYLNLICFALDFTRTHLVFNI